MDKFNFGSLFSQQGTPGGMSSQTNYGSLFSWNAQSPESAFSFNNHKQLDSQTHGSNASFLPKIVYEQPGSNQMLNQTGGNSPDPATTFTEKQYYKQYDPRFASTQMVPGLTISKAGCVITSLANIALDMDIKIDGQTADPNNLTNYLKNNRGLSLTGNLQWPAYQNLTGTQFQRIEGAGSAEFVKEHLDQGAKCLIQKVGSRGTGSHFVYAKGYKDDTFDVIDPAARDSDPNRLRKVR
jgi:hypothetical protein